MEILFKINIEFFDHYHFRSFIQYYEYLIIKCSLLKDEMERHSNSIRFFQKNSSNKFRKFHAVVHSLKDLVVG